MLRKLTFYVNGEKQSFKLALISKGKVGCDRKDDREFDDNGFELHRILPSGYEHFFTPDAEGNISGIRIEKDGKVITNSVEYWSDDKRFQVRKTENYEDHEVQYFIHEYSYDKEGNPVKVKLYG